METLKVALVDFWPEIEHENIFLPILEKHFDVQVTRINPDIVIHSIFGRMQETPKYKCKKILFLGENWRPEQFGSDYSISFDPHTDKNFRLPLWQFYLLLRPELQTLVFDKKPKHEKFDRFCSFTVSNPGNFMRNSFFGQLSQQGPGKVFSYGRYMTNDLSLQKESQGTYWRDAKYNFFKNNRHKYSIAFENNSYPYYCTEKLMDAFLAGSIPLYWGDPKIKEDWNSDAFINVGKIGADPTIKNIRDMETNDSLFYKIYNEPIFTEEQKTKHINNITNFEKWFIEIIKNK